MMRSVGPWVLFGCLAWASAVSAEVPRKAADHVAQAEVYERKASDLNPVISEHQRMKEDYRKSYYVDDRLTPVETLEQVEDLCNQIVQETQDLQDAYLELARWHRKRAAAMQ